MQFVEEDLVDCQPLVIRFVAEPEMNKSTAQELAAFVSDWFDYEAATNADDWQMAKEWSATVTDSGVLAMCEFMPMNYVAKLGRDLETAFPMIKEIRLGTPLDGPSTCVEMDWLKLPKGEVVIGKRKVGVAPFEITFTPVTLGQFQEFLTATDYSPVPDQKEKSPGFLVEHFTINFGPSPKHPLFGVTHDDACAFCEWARLRLPTDEELAHFFDYSVRQGFTFEYSGECWTATSAASDKYVVRDGPYQTADLKTPNRNRKLLHRHQYEFLEAPCFRVVRDSP